MEQKWNKDGTKLEQRWRNRILVAVLEQTCGKDGWQLDAASCARAFAPPLANSPHFVPNVLNKLATLFRGVSSLFQNTSCTLQHCTAGCFQNGGSSCLWASMVTVVEFHGGSYEIQ